MKRYLQALENIRPGDVFYSYLGVTIVPTTGLAEAGAPSHFVVLDKHLVMNPVPGDAQIDPHLRMLVLWGQTIGYVWVSPGWLLELQNLNGKFVLFEIVK